MSRTRYRQWPPPFAPLTVARLLDKSGIGTGIRKAAVRAASPSACAWANGRICPFSAFPFGNLNRSERLGVIIHPRCRQILEGPAVASGDP
jgi:hypothetical protein